MNRGQVYFSISGGDFDPVVVTRRLGIEPTSVWRQGEKVEQSRVAGRLIPRSSMWQLSTPEVEGEIVDVYQMSASIVSVLSDRAPAIAEVTKQLGLYCVLEIVLHIAVDDQVSTPIIGFAPEVIAFLAGVGASIDVDTYRC